MRIRLTKFLNPRNWLRFRLKTLLSLISLVAVFLGWIGFHSKGKQHEQAILSKITGVVEVGEADLLLF